MTVQEGSPVAQSAVVRRRFKAGASVRLLHPQRSCDAVWKVLALLEGEFQCAMGCNVYLTPPASQVRAPALLQAPASRRARLLVPQSCKCGAHQRRPDRL